MGLTDNKVTGSLISNANAPQAIKNEPSTTFKPLNVIKRELFRQHDTPRNTGLDFF